MKVYTKRLKDSQHFATIEEKHRRFPLCREDVRYLRNPIRKKNRNVIIIRIRKDILWNAFSISSKDSEG